MVSPTIRRMLVYNIGAKLEYFFKNTKKFFLKKEEDGENCL